MKGPALRGQRVRFGRCGERSLRRLNGTSKLITWVMWSMSIPRAATSEHTRMLRLSVRNASSVSIRLGWLRSPCMGAAVKPGLAQACPRPPKYPACGCRTRWTTSAVSACTISAQRGLLFLLIAGHHERVHRRLPRMKRVARLRSPFGLRRNLSASFRMGGSHRGGEHQRLSLCRRAARQSSRCLG